MQIGGEVVLISLQEYVALNLLIGWIRYTYTYTVFLNVKGTFTYLKQLVLALNLFSLGEKIWIHSGHLYLILTRPYLPCTIKIQVGRFVGRCCARAFP
jgi:hypothetical protein